MIRYALFAIAVLLIGIGIGLLASKFRRPASSASRAATVPPRASANWPAIAAVLSFAAAAAIAIAVALAE